MVGKTLAHYKVLDKLGAGGMGEVYRARDTKLDRDVAIKVLPEELARNPERRKRFEREAKAVAALKHPNIVTIHSVEYEDGVQFITMELVEGATLASLIPDGGFGIDDFFDIAIPLVDAVSSAHSKGIAHRDLKPANVMIDDDGRVKILDFGLAKLFESDPSTDKTIGAESDTAEGRILGTAAYMSPEQAEGEKVDHRSDVFSLGIMFYEMITGEKPFKGKTNISTLSSILRDTPAPIAELKPLLPHHLGRIVRRCLEKDPGRRYQTALDLRNDIEDLREETVSGLSTTSEATGAYEKVASRPGGGWIFKIGIPAVVVVVALGTYVLLRGGNPPGDEAGGHTMRLAVLPFENLGDTEDEYFADGITDEITAKLAGIPEIAVISRASARKYKDSDKDMQTIGSELDVDYVLEGTIRWDKSGSRERVRITPQLIDVSNDSHVWAENYEREINEIFVVQADIARQIAGALNVTIGGARTDESDGAPTDNVAAYQAYLRSTQLDEEEAPKLLLSIDLLQRATELDPSFVAAWAQLSIKHSGMVHFGYDRTQERLDKARAAAERAAALDPDRVESYLAMAYYHYWGRKDYDRALEAIDNAERIAPKDPRVLTVKSFVLRRQGKLEECLAYMKRAFELDPQNAVTCRDIAYTASLLHRYDEALADAERAIDISPDFVASYEIAAEIYVRLGDVQTAARTLERAPGQRTDEFQGELMGIRFVLKQFDEIIEIGSREPEKIVWQQETALPFAYWVARVREQQGNTAEAKRNYEIALSRLSEENERSPDDYRLHSAIGDICAALGRKDDAIRHGSRSKELMPVTKDYLNSVYPIWWMAMIYARVGEPQLALDEIEYLLANPTYYSTSHVRLEPVFDSLRGDPRYNDLMARYAMENL